MEGPSALVQKRPLKRPMDATSVPLKFPPDFKLSVVVPVYNEVATIEEIVSRVRGSGVPNEIILVDDGSSDGSAKILARLALDEDVRLITHQRNLGKGAAVRSGCQIVKGSCVIIQDADLEYNPRDYMRLVEPIVNGEADAVFGSRFSPEVKYQDSRWHRWGNRFITGLSNMMTGLTLTDVETCYKVMRCDFALDILTSLRETGFGMEIELASALANRGCRIVEVPVEYSSRTYAEGKKIGFRDGLRALWCIWKY